MRAEESWSVYDNNRMRCKRKRIAITRESAAVDDEYSEVIQVAIVRGAFVNGMQLGQAEDNLFAVGLAPHVSSNVIAGKQHPFRHRILLDLQQLISHWRGTFQHVDGHECKAPPQCGHGGRCDSKQSGC